ncbi:hypothetical protein JM949_35750 [Micromonospora sp. STR1s_6]|uniref:Uncharacterized protein n=1 Tax=Micromonospora tarensis TaxID=2806100 RepID=A0ABS1YS43_9ACTN|nr:hypothetical protein [Micromonospora tarensis]
MLGGRVLGKHPQRTGQHPDVGRAELRLHEVDVEEQVEEQFGTAAAGEDQRVVGQPGAGELTAGGTPLAYAGEPGHLHGLRVEQAVHPNP